MAHSLRIAILLWSCLVGLGADYFLEASSSYRKQHWKLVPPRQPSVSLLENVFVTITLILVLSGYLHPNVFIMVADDLIISLESCIFCLVFGGVHKSCQLCAK